MKAYVKPAMMALSISANDMLCSGTCEVTTRDSTDPIIQSLNKMWGAGGENNDILDPKDNVFGNVTDCADRILEGYCKYTATEQGLTQLFTS